jgi:glycosyltransferase involved in cell wall biosynthesis
LEPVSVIIPTYNRARLVPRAVASALAAMEPQDELIVVDDGSTDDTESALESFRDRIRYVRTENRGVGAARNTGVAEACSPLISFLDSDDEWMADGLRLRRSVMSARPDLVFCFSDFAMRDQNGRAVHKYLVHWHKDTRSWHDILEAAVTFSSLDVLPPGRSDFLVHVGDMYPLLLQRSYVPAWTSLVRRELAGDDFRFTEDLVIGEEWACFGRIARRGPVAFLDCETAWNHGHSGRRVSSDAGFIGLLESHLQLAERIWGSDSDFMMRRLDLYNQTIASLRLERARWYLGQGMSAEARRDLAAVGAAPRSLKMLARIPGWLLRIASRARRTAMQMRHGTE